MNLVVDFDCAFLLVIRVEGQLVLSPALKNACLVGLQANLDLSGPGFGQMRIQRLNCDGGLFLNALADIPARRGIDRQHCHHGGPNSDHQAFFHVQLPISQAGDLRRYSTKS